MTARLAVDMTRCAGHGLCAVLAHDAVQLDQWGYPVPGDEELTGPTLRRAERAAKACPRRALILRAAPATGPTVAS